eukprot:INCI6363.2.p2 GENE.INCI6363.2~~INCI6363.2.p2  ORF type:complete len:177 (-),score=29.75 INCI6363.2:226-756(-)
MPLPATSSSTPSPAPGAAATSARNAEAPQGTTTAAATVAEPTVPLFTMEQVQTMARQRRRCVLVIHGDVVDVPQSFMLEHPGGFAIINNENGTDATVYFEDIGHSTDARRCVQSFKIGRLEGAPATLAGESAGTSSNLEAASAAAKALAAKNGFDKLSAAVSAIVFASTLVLLLVS